MNAADRSDSRRSKFSISWSDACAVTEAICSVIALRNG